ncbi:MAG TPA: hypothetical protein DEP11_03135 [Candidatus Jacksonbacteria bacterium]|nr:hypothetical protein [Candidatus Jacksonbacteria bacterium]
MRISSIQLDGFKSFRAETTLTFPKSITAIVGPNGSGKSNVADAFRWVLGEQSLKAVRSEDQTDVIFGGSAKQHKLSRAAVTIRFLRDENDNKGNIDSPEIEIRRKIYINGESSYELQKRSARLLDIQLFLAERNVGERNYAVIGQGQIDEVLRRSPADRMDFFYEATGVKKYQIKLHKARLKLSSSRERISQTNALLKELGPRKSYLEKQAGEYARRKNIMDDLSKKYRIYYRGLLFEFDAELARKHHDLQQLEKEFKKAETSALNLESEIERATSDFSHGEKDARIMSEISRLSCERDLARESLREVQHSARERLLGEGKFDIAFLRRRAQELEELLTAIRKESYELEASITQITARFVAGEKEISKIAQTILGLKNHQTFSKLVVIEKLEEIVEFTDSARVKKELREFIEQLRRDDIASSISEREELYREQKAAHDEVRIELKVLEEKRGMITGAERRSRSEYEDVKLKLQKSEFGVTEQLLKDVELVISERKIELAEIDAGIKKYEDERRELTREMDSGRLKLVELQKSYRGAEEQKSHVSDLLQAVKIDIVRIETKREEAVREMVEKVGEALAETISNTKDTIQNPNDLRALKADLRLLEHDAALIGEVPEDVLAEYKEVKERFDFLTAQSSDLDSAVASLEKISLELEREIKTQFAEKFHNLNLAFGAYINELFSGGNGELSEITIQKENDEGNIVERDGVEITAHPPGKKIKHTGALSGGERSLVAVALLCAIISSNPPPFVILDEIDAALDEANSKRLADIIQKLSARTQFIIITHNRTTMEVADSLYGVTMDDDGVSRLVSVSLEGYE